MRTKKTTLNLLTSFLPWIIIFILGFLKVKWFIANYGSELNGLIQLAGQTYNYLAILEFGFGAAIVYNLYKPLAENNKQRINEIFSESKRIYFKIGLSIFIFGLIISFAAPFVIKRGNVDSLVILSIFLLFNIDYLTLYMFGMPYQSLLVADQKMYHINIIKNSKQIIFKCIELILIYLSVNYLIILIISIIFNAIAIFLIIRRTKKSFSYLKYTKSTSKDIHSMSKDVFVHKIEKVIFNSTDGILLSIFSGLRLVSIYGSFNYIVTIFKTMVGFLIGSAQASFGNVFVEKNQKSNSIYFQFQSLISLISIIISAVLFATFNSFISFWINNTYVISTFNIFLFTLIVWFEFNFGIINLLIDANGKYKETKMFGIYAMLFNLVLSIILVSKLGITGVLLPTVLSYLFIRMPLNSNFVYKQILNVDIKKYYRLIAASFILMIILMILNTYILSIFSIKTIYDWFIVSTIVFVFNTIIVTTIFLFFSESFNMLFQRIIIRKKRVAYEN